MSNKAKTKSTTLDLNEIKKLLGPPAVLSSESIKDYDAILQRLMECVEPRDAIEQLFVSDFAEQTWEIHRLRHHKILVIERDHQQRQEKEEKRRLQLRKCRAERATEEAEKAEQAKQAEPVGESMQAEQGDQASAPTTQLERMFELEDVIDSTVAEVDDILGPADEIDHAKALQSGIAYFEKLDHLLGVAIARRDDVLAQIDFYRQGLGQRLRRVPDEIIDAEFKETDQEAPSITGPDGDAQ